MDIAKPQQRKARWNISWLKWPLLLVAILLLAWWALDKSTRFSMPRSELLLANVEQGDLTLSVHGYGRLLSEHQQLLTAYSGATVKQIVLKPGAKVSRDSLILLLENPELEQQYQRSEQQYQQALANLRQLKLNQQREALNEQANLAQLRASYQSAALREQAESKLVESGIVSQLNYQQSKLDAEQLAQRIALQQQRIEQLQQVHSEAENIQQQNIAQQQALLTIAKDRLARLQVKAGIDGVLQRLSVELGQSVSPGQELALLGSVQQLIALLRVPQSQAEQVQLGQETHIDTRGDQVMGKVQRIDPIVVDNSVEIEIALSGELPPSARPHASIDGEIITGSVAQALYIQRPAGIVANSQRSLYRLRDSRATLQALQFGATTEQYIHIRQGAKAGEQFIISDLAHLQADYLELTVN